MTAHIGYGNLNTNALIKILTEPKDALYPAYQHLLETNGHKLVMTPGALKAIADIAAQKNTGARGLRSIIEEVLEDILFIAPDWKPSIITVTEGCVLNGEKPEVQEITDTDAK